jgi:hypothetical protein
VQTPTAIPATSASDQAHQRRKADAIMQLLRDLEQRGDRDNARKVRDILRRVESLGN